MTELAFDTVAALVHTLKLHDQTDKSIKQLLRDGWFDDLLRANLDYVDPVEYRQTLLLGQDIMRYKVQVDRRKQLDQLIQEGSFDQHDKRYDEMPAEQPRLYGDLNETDLEREPVQEIEVFLVPAQQYLERETRNRYAHGDRTYINSIFAGELLQLAAQHPELQFKYRIVVTEGFGFDLIKPTPNLSHKNTRRTLGLRDGRTDVKWGEMVACVKSRHPKRR